MTSTQNHKATVSTAPDWQLAWLWFRSRTRLSRRASRLALYGTSAVLVVVAGVTMGFATIGNRLYALPDHDALIDVFFRIIFVPMIYLLIAWFVASLKFDAERSNEYLFLNSLPLSSSAIHRMFVFSEMSRFLWVPGGLLVLLLALAATIPLPYVMRLIVIVVISYWVLQVAGIALHLAMSLKGSRGALGFPSGRSPLIQLAIMLAWTATPVMGIIIPGKISGGSFWIVLSMLVVVSITLFYVSKILFDKWRERNVIQRSMVSREKKAGITYRTFDRLLRALPGVKPNPFLIKNLVRSSREESVLSRSILSLFFIVFAFLIATNNDSMRDAVTVLIWIFAIFVFFVVMKAVDRLGAGEESPDLTYAVPVTRGQIYFSVVLPVMVWLGSIALALAILVGFAGGGVRLASGFFVRAVLIALFFSSIAVSLGVSCYPDQKAALKRFLGWMLATALLVVVFYQFKVIVAVTVVLLSLSLMMRTRLYQVR